MPWKVSQVMDERVRFVMKVLENRQPMAELCREYGISRKTGYKWVDRFRSLGASALGDASRRPTRHPLSVGGDMVADICHIRTKHPNWSGIKLRPLLLAMHPTGDIPRARTIDRVIKRAGLVKPRRRRREVPPERIQRAVTAQAPNEVWTIDFKGWWLTLDNRKCEPLTIRDDYSRFILAIQGMRSTRWEAVREVMAEVFKHYGLPLLIRSDNGSPFAASNSLCGLTRLSAWWMAQGIHLHRIDPGKPAQNGGHERMHRDIKAELQSTRALSLATQQTAFDIWRQEFNNIRVHQALGNQVPASVYRKSSHLYTECDIEIGYPNHFEVRKVSASGHIRIGGLHSFLSSALAGWDVGLEHLGNDRIQVWFTDHCIGVTDRYMQAWGEPEGNNIEIPIAD